MSASDDYAAMVRSLTASAAKRAPAKRSGPLRAVGLTVWGMALVIGAVCLVVHLSASQPVPHRAAVPRCTLSAPCYSHGGGKLVTAYVLVRTARGIVRMPLHAARLYYRLRMLRGPQVNLTLPSWGDR